ncbi:MAG: GNAT family N-acetyltransferase [Chloroflexota bacterium]|nr:GNAT family N-acetyltransferase [Chloroflexota bacterium]
MSLLDRVDEVPPIRTRRLELVSLSPAFMRAVLNRDLAAAEADLGASIPRDLRERLGGLFETRLAEIDNSPSIRPWVARGMVLTDDLGIRRLVGSVGFHGPPDASRRAEVGYHVEPNFRRRGLAVEAVRALLDWASREHGIHDFRASIAPTNAPSLAVVGRLGFLQVGSRWDDVDGEELIFELDSWVAEAAG